MAGSKADISDDTVPHSASSLGRIVDRLSRDCWQSSGTALNSSRTSIRLACTRRCCRHPSDSLRIRSSAEDVVEALVAATADAVAGCSDVAVAVAAAGTAESRPSFEGSSEGRALALFVDVIGNAARWLLPGEASPAARGRFGLDRWLLEFVPLLLLLRPAGIFPSMKLFFSALATIRNAFAVVVVVESAHR
jgi:hypothetical protein